MSYSFSIFLRDFVSQQAVRMQASVGRVAQAITNTASRIQRFSGNAGRSLDQLNNQLNQLSAARGAATSVAQIRRLNQEIRNTERDIRRLENIPPKSFIQRIKEATGSLAGLAGIAGGIAIVTAGIAGVKNIAALGMEAEQTRIRFEVMLGSAEKANRMIADITDYAIKTPFASADLKQAGELLLNFGITGEKVMPTLKMLGDVSGGNKDRLQGMTLAFSQMSSTGRLMGQDLNQMINAGFNPLQVISENTGISMGKLKEQMEAGMISVDMVTEAFKLATGPGGRFNGMLDKIALTAKGQLDSAMESIEAQLTAFGEKNLVPLISKLAVMAEKFFGSIDRMGAALQPFFDTLMPLWDAIVGFTASFFGLDTASMTTDGVLNLLEKTLTALGWILTIVANAIRGTIAILTPFAPLIKAITIIVGGFALAIWAVNYAMVANPVGWVIAGIVLLIGIIVTCWQRFEIFRGIVMGAWEAVKGFGDMIKNYVINRLKELLAGVAGIGKALFLFFSGDFKKAWEVGKKASSDLLGVGSASKLVDDGKKIAKKVGEAYNAEFVKKQTPRALDVALPKKTSQAASVGAERSKVYDLLGNGESKKGKKGKDGKGSGGTNKSDGIIGGGSKITHITINLAKMQDQIVINTINTGEGATKMRQILEEELNRLLGSAAAMQV